MRFSWCWILISSLWHPGTSISPVNHENSNWNTDQEQNACFFQILCNTSAKFPNSSHVRNIDLISKVGNQSTVLLQYLLFEAFIFYYFEVL